MSFRRRSSSKPSSSRGCNKVRITNRQDVAEIESWVDFASQNNSNDEDEIGFPSLNKKEESKESVYVERERMKKRHVKSLHKQSFEEQMLSEFRQFSNGIMSKLDEQNKILAQLVSMQKSTHTSFQAVQNFNVKQERLEMEYNNDHSEIVEHQIDKPELFHDPYPYERFESYQLQNLEKESLKFYKEQLKFSENDKPLAYYFFEHRNLSKGVKTGIKTAYKCFKEKYNSFTINNLKNHFTNLDITNSMTATSLSLNWERMKRIATCSYGIKKRDFPKIKFSSNKQGREENVSAINKDQFLEASKLLCKQKQFDDALLINIMWSFASRPSEILTLRFEDFEDKDNQKSVFYYANKKNQRKKFTISDELYDQVMEFKEHKISNGTYIEKVFITPTGKSIKGHFVFDLTRSMLQKKFSRKFAKLIPGLKSRPKDIRMSSISNEFREHGIQRAASLGQHTSIKTTQKHYTRAVKDFK